MPMQDVTVDGFIGKRIDQNYKCIIAGLKSPIPKGFEARAAGRELPDDCKYRLVADTDLYKWLEGACYVYARTRNPGLRSEIDRIVALILKCQKPDGYINTQVPPRKRFDPLVRHELYSAGHFFETAAAHHRATKQNDLVQAACRWADYLINEYVNGNPYFRLNGNAYRDHNECELGLLRLYRVTGQKKYLDFAIQLAKEFSVVEPGVKDTQSNLCGDNNSGKHAVRFNYMLTGLADLYFETDGQDIWLQRLSRYLPDLWDELVNTRTYVTGGVGSHGEFIGDAYELPLQRLNHSHRHLGETCACISMMMYSWRMHALTGRSSCFDYIERALYNHFLGALSLDQMANFYYNPIHVVGNIKGKTDHYHSPMRTRVRLPKIHRCTCCMPNAWRFLGALPEYVFSRDADGVFVNLYSSATVNHALDDGRRIKLAVETDYPNNGDVMIRFNGRQPTRFKLRLRIPGWCRDAKVAFGGRTTPIAQGGDYFVLDETWKPGDTARLTLPMPPRMIVPDPRIKAQTGRVAFARGPLVYCLEKPDISFPVEQARVQLKPAEITDRLRIKWHDDLLGGIHVLHVPGLAGEKHTELPLVPWYTRANRSNDSRWVVMIPNLEKW